MGSSKKGKDKDKSRDERKKKKHRSRSRSKDRESKQRHKHKKRSHRREHLSRSRSPLSDISDISDGHTPNDVRNPAMMEAPPAPRITVQSSAVSRDYREEEDREIEDRAHPSSPRGNKRKKDGEENEERRTKKSKEDKIGEGWGGGNEDGAGLSLSIRETNKIRAKLGLKPLHVDDHTVQTQQNESEVIADSGDEVSESKLTKIIEDSHEFLHKPAQNLRDKLQVEKLREKIAVQREKRKQKNKLKKVKTLADSDSDDDALAWVKKNRRITKDREEADKITKQLEELDAQFGVGDLIDEEVAKDNRKAYGSKSLAGIKVQHHHTRFGEGTTILTLADAEILGESEDTLVNVNLIDSERAEKNIELRNNKTDEEEYEAPEMDVLGNMLQKDVLKKYDEELDGPRKSSFRLGVKGQAILDNEALAHLGEKERKMARLKKLQSLTREGGLQLASEYLTPAETVTFKKVKKVKRKKKKMLTADDLEPIEDNELHHGSRGRRRGGDEGGDSMKEVKGNRVKNLRELMEEDDEDGNMMEVDNNTNNYDYEGINDDDDLQEALARSRKAKFAKQRQLDVENMKEMIQNSIDDNKAASLSHVSLNDLLPSSANEGDAGLLVTLNTTDEFCRTLGDIPTYGLSGNRAEDEQANVSTSTAGNNGVGGNGEEETQPSTGTWEEVGIEDTRVEIGESEALPILDEEPDASVGVANALKLAIKKGYLEKDDNVKKSNAGLQHLRAVNYSIDDKAGDDDRRGRGRDNDRYSGPVSDFKEKDGYKPSIYLEYVDDEGRKLCPKEAFRYLSHKFHGKGSGKNKTEKRMKKWQQDLLMNQMSSSDTPLQTLERQIEKQKALGTSYLLLSGNKHQEPASAEGKIRK